MAHKKSLISNKLQVPAVIVLAVVFVLLLVFRAMKHEGDVDATVRATNHDTQAMAGSETLLERVPASDLRNLVLTFQDTSEAELVAPPLEQNPFLIPDDAFTRTLPDQAAFGDEPAPESEFDRSRARELNSMVLSGTSKIGDRYMAIVNGMVLGKGDQIDGYSIVEVGEGFLTVENRWGVRIVRMKKGGSR